MRDNLIFKNIIEILRAGMDAQDFEDVKIKQAFQPRNQGANTAPTLYIHKLGDHRYGFPKREDIWDQETSTMIHEEKQIYESMFQITGLSIQDPKKAATQPTASDIVNAASHAMQSDYAIKSLLAKELSIYRVTAIRNPYFVDDKERFEASPSFDFTLQHEQVIISTTPIISDYELNIERV
jgi:hypothetical protein